MTDFLGHSNNFATLSYICANRQSTTFIKIRARARKYTAFHAFVQGKPAFCN